MSESVYARPLYPFTALVGLESLKMALLLAAIDGRLGVLVRGDKGAGKSTAARGLAGLLMDGAPFVDLPVGATEDRLLGGLDLDRALKGEPALKPGLLARAHGGVLYADEVNLLPDHLADALLDAAASGTHVIEREGFSVAQPARFTLIGSMNPEEGALRPQLLDRFALCVDVAAPRDPLPRRLAIERRLQFDADPTAFVARARDDEDRLRARLEDARTHVESIGIARELLDSIAADACARGSTSLRADLAIVRASRALAAFEGATAVTAEHIQQVRPLALAHRGDKEPPNSRSAAVRSSPDESFRTGPDDETGGASADDDGERRDNGQREDDLRDKNPGRSRVEDDDRVFVARTFDAPRLLVATPEANAADAAGGRRVASGGDGRLAQRLGPVIGTRPLSGTERADTSGQLDVRTTLAHALARTGAPQPAREDLHETVRAPIAGTRFLFVVDASGSQAARQRMRLVKGAVSALLTSSVRRHDEVVVVAFRGVSASTVLEPTRDAEAARLALAYLPTGGRTPLAHGLELAGRYVTAQTALILLTDGRANVPSRTGDAWADALAAAAALSCPALVIDSEGGTQRTGRAAELARAMGARHAALDGLDDARVVQLVRGGDDRGMAADQL